MPGRRGGVASGGRRIRTWSGRSVLGLTGLLLLVGACAPVSRKSSGPSEGSAPATGSGKVDAGASSAKPGDSAALPITGPPPGYVEMKVLGILPTSQGDAVMLVDDARRTMVPIFVGGTEALSINLRLGRRHYERPLTHDLFDTTVRELGARLVKVHVDDLKGQVYLGTIFVRQGDRIIEVDARPSDAIALALGNRVPIYVARSVMDAAGVPYDPAKGADREAPSAPEPRRPPSPMKEPSPGPAELPPI
jgi:uncharacterized protein